MANRPTDLPPRPSHMPVGSLRDFDSIVAVLSLLTKKLPDRTSVRQVYALALAITHLLGGKAVTVTDVINAGGEFPDGRRVLGQSMEKTFGIFKQPTSKYPDALGWLDATQDPDDRRKHYLSLTPAGIDACRDIVEAFHS
jgi:hypothetical protein